MRPAASQRSVSAATQPSTRALSALTSATARSSAASPAKRPAAAITGSASARPEVFQARTSADSSSITMPARYGVPVSTSNRSICPDAARIAAGPSAVPRR